ncbi:mucin-2-like [Lytechinus pictus]|uniref:mucin-2-like n=1 Tax=Lytechinus pictus TaxID=7653 RepID=UPI0030B9DF94
MEIKQVTTVILVLLCDLIMDACSVCSPPVLSEPGLLVNPDQNKYAEMDIIILYCDPSLYLLHDGPSFSFCMSGVWVEDPKDAVCHESCDPPVTEWNVAHSNQETGEYDLQHYLHGSMTVYTCNNELAVLDGPTKASCRDGTWDPPDLPVCRACQQPQFNQDVVYVDPVQDEGYRDFDVVYFHCNRSLSYVAYVAICYNSSWVPIIPDKICHETTSSRSPTIPSYFPTQHTLETTNSPYTGSTETGYTSEDTYTSTSTSSSNVPFSPTTTFNPGTLASDILTNYPSIDYTSETISLLHPASTETDITSEDAYSVTSTPLSNMPTSESTTSNTEEFTSDTTSSYTKTLLPQTTMHLITNEDPSSADSFEGETSNYPSTVIEVTAETSVDNIRTSSDDQARTYSFETERTSTRTRLQDIFTTRNTSPRETTLEDTVTRHRTMTELHTTPGNFTRTALLGRETTSDATQAETIHTKYPVHETHTTFKMEPTVTPSPYTTATDDNMGTSTGIVDTFYTGKSTERFSTPYAPTHSPLFSTTPDLKSSTLTITSATIPYIPSERTATDASQVETSTGTVQTGSTGKSTETFQTTYPPSHSPFLSIEPVLEKSTSRITFAHETTHSSVATPHDISSSYSTQRITNFVSSSETHKITQISSKIPTICNEGLTKEATTEHQKSKVSATESFGSEITSFKTSIYDSYTETTSAVGSSKIDTSSIEPTGLFSKSTPLLSTLAEANTHTLLSTFAQERTLETLASQYSPTNRITRMDSTIMKSTNEATMKPSSDKPTSDVIPTSPEATREHQHSRVSETEPVWEDTTSSKMSTSLSEIKTPFGSEEHTLSFTDIMDMATLLSTATEENTTTVFSALAKQTTLPNDRDATVDRVTQFTDNTVTRTTLSHTTPDGLSTTAELLEEPPGISISSDFTSPETSTGIDKSETYSTSLTERMASAMETTSENIYSPTTLFDHLTSAKTTLAETSSALAFTSSISKSTFTSRSVEDITITETGQTPLAGARSTNSFNLVSSTSIIKTTAEPTATTTVEAVMTLAYETETQTMRDDISPDATSSESYTHHFIPTFQYNRGADNTLPWWMHLIIVCVETTLVLTGVAFIWYRKKKASNQIQRSLDTESGTASSANSGSEKGNDTSVAIGDD